MSVYRHPNCRAIVEITPAERLSNQVIFEGTNQSISVTKGVFLLSHMEIETGKTVTIKDGQGTTLATGITGFSRDYVPLRCDYGIEIVGDVVFAVGSVHEEIFA
jgi:hypothetical protein